MWVPIVNYVALRQQSDGIKQLEDGVARLVNDHHHNPLTVAQTKVDINQFAVLKTVRKKKTLAVSLFEQLHNRDSSVCIQPSGRLIQKQNLGFNDKLHSNVGSLPLSTRHTTKKLCTHL